MTHTDFLCQVLRGEPVAWPCAEADATRLFDVAEAEGVHLLVAHRLRHLEYADACHSTLRERFETALCAAVAVDQITAAELRKVITSLRGDGVRPLIFKGAAVSITHYPDPVLRPRADVDLLVSYDQVRTATRVFERLGYDDSLSVTGELVKSSVSDRRIDRYLVSSQVAYTRIDGYGVPHAFDVHWRVSIPQVFANVLSFEELDARAISVPSLGKGARAIGAAHALAIACIHRVAHHHGADRLIWLHDIHLLAETLEASEVEHFLQLAATKQIAAVCVQGISVARERFGTIVTGGLFEELRSIAAGHGPEASAAFLRSELRKVDVLFSDLTALRRFRQQFWLIKEHLFPPATYMHKVYGTSSQAILPVLYLRRVIEGARGWFRQ